MPKDFIHFKVARLAADKLADTTFAPCLDAHPQLFMLGAVIHDALFYGITKAARPLEHLAHRLHGADGQDTYTLLRLQATHAATTDTPPAAALLAGITSHLCADMVMHPMVWHLTGDYYAPEKHARSLARQRHRALESLMDMVACPEMFGRPLFSVNRLVRFPGDALYTALPMHELAKLSGISPHTAQKGLKSALRVYGDFQAAYPITWLARTLFSLLPILPNCGRELAALFYAPQLTDQSHQLSGPIHYKHPVTGETTTETLIDMMDDAAERTATLCRTMENAVFEGTPFPLSEDGPSLDTGLTRTPTNQMRHFSHPPFPKLP